MFFLLYETIRIRPQGKTAWIPQRKLQYHCIIPPEICQSDRQEMPALFQKRACRENRITKKKHLPGICIRAGIFSGKTTIS